VIHSLPEREADAEVEAAHARVEPTRSPSSSSPQARPARQSGDQHTTHVVREQEMVRQTLPLFRTSRR